MAQICKCNFKSLYGDVVMSFGNAREMPALEMNDRHNISTLKLNRFKEGAGQANKRGFVIVVGVTLFLKKSGRLRTYL